MLYCVQNIKKVHERGTIMNRKNTILNKTMGGITKALFAAAICCMIALPWLLDLFLELSPYNYLNADRTYMLILSYLSGACAAVILFFAIKIFSQINQKTPFTNETVRYIKAIGCVCIAITAIYTAAVFFLQSILIFGIILAFAFISALIFVIADLFKKAVEYKEENELTV